VTCDAVSRKNPKGNPELVGKLRNEAAKVGVVHMLYGLNSERNWQRLRVGQSNLESVRGLNPAEQALL
jgi:hypothetical protein